MLHKIDVKFRKKVVKYPHCVDFLYSNSSGGKYVLLRTFKVVRTFSTFNGKFRTF